MNKDELIEKLPYGKPFLFVDSIDEISDAQSKATFVLISGTAATPF